MHKFRSNTASSGVAVDNADVNIDSEHFVGDLGKRGLHALAVGMNSDPDLQATIRKHLHHSLVVTRNDRQSPSGKNAGAMGGLLAVAGKSHADEPAIGLALTLSLAPAIQINLVSRVIDLLIIAAVIMLPRDIVVRHGGCRNEIFKPNLPWLPVDRTRNSIDG